uniref:adenylate kinase n=1 Tax=Kalanchoe fedtschenkoi TaxID=63787 RepID=A0A7N0UVV3_KALFE
MAGISRLRALAHSMIRCVPTGSAGSRSYGCAAAQLQYDSDEDCYELEDRRVGGPMAESEGFVTGRGVQWVVIGEPGAKKHLYAERLAKLLEVPHISMGSLVRQELNPRSSLYKQIENALNERKLVPEDIVFALLSRRLEEGYCRGESGFILDGIPRNKTQAEILDQVADIDLVLNFKCTENDLVKQHVGRGAYSPRGFHSLVHPGQTGNLPLPESEKIHLNEEQVPQ